MINVKDKIYAALAEKFGEEKVSEVYPAMWTNLPAIQYTEENNSVFEWTDDKEQKAVLRYRIDIWNSTSTSIAALEVDEALSALGLFRTACADVQDPSALRHKQMRYEAIIDVETEDTYWPE